MKAYSIFNIISILYMCNYYCQKLLTKLEKRRDIIKKKNERGSYDRYCTYYYVC